MQSSDISHEDNAVWYIIASRTVLKPVHTQYQGLKILLRLQQCGEGDINMAHLMNKL